MIFDFDKATQLLISVIALVLSSNSYAGIQYIVLSNHKFEPKENPIVRTTKAFYKPRKSNNNQFDSIINFNATKYQISPFLIKAMIKKESDYVVTAVSSKGASGLMQLMPSTAAKYGSYDLFNPHHNIAVGTKHFVYLLNKYKKLHLALAAYNAGEGNVAKYGGIPPFNETEDYVVDILKSYNRSLDNNIKLLKNSTNSSLVGVGKMNSSNKYTTTYPIEDKTKINVRYFSITP